MPTHSRTPGSRYRHIMPTGRTSTGNRFLDEPSPSTDGCTGTAEEAARQAVDGERRAMESEKCVSTHQEVLCDWPCDTILPRFCKRLFPDSWCVEMHPILAGHAIRGYAYEEVQRRQGEASRAGNIRKNAYPLGLYCSCILIIFSCMTKKWPCQLEFTTTSRFRLPTVGGGCMFGHQ